MEFVYDVQEEMVAEVGDMAVTRVEGVTKFYHLVQSQHGLFYIIYMNES